MAPFTGFLNKLKSPPALNAVGDKVEILSAGTLGEEEVSLDSVKEIIMKDLDIFLDNAIFPAIEKKLHPPQERAEAGEADASAEAEGGAGEDEAEA